LAVRHGREILADKRNNRAMNAHLPADLEQFVKKKVLSGRFSSEDEAIIEAVRLLRAREEAEEACTLEGIRQGLEDLHAGRGRPAEEVLAEIRRDYNLASDA
jgi:antitoxin ParD1/3/4